MTAQHSIVSALLVMLGACGPGYPLGNPGPWRHGPIAPVVNAMQETPVLPGTPLAFDVSWRAECSRGTHDFG